MQVSKNFIQGEKQCQVRTEVEKRKRKCPEAARRKEVNWLAHYESIRDVCPWSYRAFVSGKIITIPYADSTFNTFALLFEGCKDDKGVETDCFVYVCEDKSVDWLTHKVEQMDELYPQQEWLYSSPDDDDGYATPVPVLIQQRKAKLTELRNKIGYVDETEQTSKGYKND